MFMTLEPESKLNKRIGAKTLTWFKFKLIFLVGDSEHTKVNKILEANEGDIAIFKLILHFAGDMQLVSTSVFSRLYIFSLLLIGHASDNICLNYWKDFGNIDYNHKQKSSCFSLTVLRRENFVESTSVMGRGS